jgi:hypothetical protein
MPTDRARARAETIRELRKQLLEAEARIQTLEQFNAQIATELVDIFTSGGTYTGAGPHWEMARDLLAKFWPDKWGAR